MLNVVVFPELCRVMATSGSGMGDSTLWID